MRNIKIGIAIVVLSAFCAAAIAGSATTPKSKITIHRSGDSVLLEGVKGWPKGEMQSSVQGSQAIIMQALGEDVSYDYLLGVSGLAFRMQLFKEYVCPSSPHAGCGFSCCDRSTKALPRVAKGVGVKSDDPANVAEVRKMVVDSINAGVPVEYGAEENGVIVGYRKGGAEWVCFHPFRKGGDKTFIEKQLPWGITIYTERKKVPPSRKELIVESLRQAIQMEETPESHDYWCGLTAWHKYIDTLNSLDKADEKTRTDSMIGNAWIYECLTSYRLSAARYLRSIAGEFSPEAAAHLKRAAASYEMMATSVLVDKDNCLATITPRPNTLKKGETWTSEKRAEEVRRLEKALPLERVALSEISKSLEDIK